MSTNKSILTNYGNDRILDAIATETTVPITAIVYGDGEYSEEGPSKEQTSLVNQLGKLTSITKEFNANDGFIYFKATIPANANEGESFTLREFGLLDDQNKLLTVTVVPDVTKPAASGDSGVSIALPITIGFKTSTGKVMQIVENGTDVYATTSLSNLNDEGQHHFDTVYATIDLNNLSLEGERHFLGRTHITNCLSEIPQRILCNLDNGTLTIKAGSTIIVPFGINDLSSNYPVGAEFLNANFIVETTQFANSRFFVWATLQNDITTTYVNGAYALSVFVDATNNSLLLYERSTDASGSSAPTGKTLSFYNSTTNKVSRYSAGTESYTNLSFPVVRISSDANQIVSIDEIFNGISHIGNTIVVDKNVRLLVPNGRNTNGSLNNIPHITENLLIQSGFSLNDDVNYTYFYKYVKDTPGEIKCWPTNSYYKQSPSELISTDRVYYDAATNSYVQYITSTQHNDLYCELGSFENEIVTNTNNYMLNFKSKYAFRAIDYNNFLEIIDNINALELDLETVRGTANTALDIANIAKAKADTSVQLSGNQTVAGTKTFTSAPVVPATTATGTALQLTRRATGVLQLGDKTLFQWGHGSTSSHKATVNLSYAYSSDSAYRAIVCDSGSESSTAEIKVQTQSAKKFTVYSDDSSRGNAFQWFTIGRVS